MQEAMRLTVLLFGLVVFAARFCYSAEDLTSDGTTMNITPKAPKAETNTTSGTAAEKLSGTMLFTCSTLFISGVINARFL
uniref:SMUG L protein n=1 Tax=Ascaris lumbricoides TaxID=6252 RepID=A0A0M3HFD8_ASCLU